MYCKVRFKRGSETTAGLVLSEEVIGAESVTIGDLSRLFPSFEIPKMHNLEVSGGYDTWEQAFAHKFSGENY